jgi:cleavage and polyadenylation specificity factor subunit 3
VDIDGIKVTPYRAGHVLGACMFQIDIGGLRVLYTGDYSRTPDRHLPGADLPSIPPHVVICESTYGVSPHSPREERERRFTDRVHQILNRGGKVLLPVVALGRAQELLLILEDYWVKHPELAGVPIYQASALARRAMTVYQTYINVLNSDMKAAFEEANPFVFNHVNHLAHTSGLDNVGPCVVLATPSMLQSGLSRELFEAWCGDAANGVIIADFAVQGTLAREILSDCKSIQARGGGELPLKMSVDAISFSAHADYPQTQQFLDALAPPHVVLVHGEAGEMGKLKRALEGKAAADGKKMLVYSPKNCQAVEIKHSGSKVAKVIGALAENPPSAGAHVRGLLVQKDFGHMLLAPSDLPTYTKLRTAAVSQRQMVPTTVPLTDLRFALESLFEGIHTVTTLGGAARAGSPVKEEAEEVKAEVEEVKAEEDAEKGAKRKGAKKPPASPRKGKGAKKSEVKKEEPAEDEVKDEGEAEDAGEDIKPLATEPEGLSVNGGALTIVKRPAGDAGVEHALIEWSSDPLTDMIADAVLSVILQLEEEPEGLAEAEDAHKAALEARDKKAAANARLRIVAAMLGVQFGHPDVEEETQTLRLKVDNAACEVRYATRDVECADAATKARVETALERIDMAIADSSFARTLPSVSGMSGSRGGASQLVGS